MKILFTVEFYEPSKGGAEIVVKEIAERLAKKNDVVVATSYLPHRNFDILNNVKIISFKLRGNAVNGICGKKKEINRYIDLLINGDFDVILNYAAQTWTTDLTFSILDKIEAKKVLVPCGYSGLKNKNYFNYFNELPGYLKKYDKLIYMAPNYQDKLFGDRHGVGDKAVIIPNGASEEEFLFEKTINFKNLLGIKRNYLIITVANHHRIKGHDFVIEAFKKMKRNDVTLVIIGNIPVASGPRMLKVLVGSCYFRCLAESLFNKHIKLVFGKNRDLVVSGYKESDLFLFGSKIEACAPLVMYESFASKTPFITTEIGNVKDYKDYVRIVETPEEMAQMANYLLNNPKERKVLAEKAFELWQKHHTWQKIADRYENLFRSLVYES